jgi:hypothetical protein
MLLHHLDRHALIKALNREVGSQDFAHVWANLTIVMRHRRDFAVGGDVSERPLVTPRAASHP